MGILRLLLACAVVEGHIAERSPSEGIFGLGMLNADAAVEMFFIISGFYMALVLHEKYVGPRSYSLFLQQRVLRLFPAYFIVFAIIVASLGAYWEWTGRPLGFLTLWHLYPGLLHPISLGVHAVSSLFLVGQDWLAFFRQDVVTGKFYFGQPPSGTTSVWCAGLTPNPPAWTLAVEFTFYLLAPLLVRRAIWVQALMLAASLALRNGFYYSGIWFTHGWVYFFFPSTLCFFLAGSLGYRLYRAQGVRLAAFGSRFGWILGSFWLLVLFFRHLPMAPDLVFPLLVLGALLVPVLFAWTRQSRLDRLIGETSYPLYLIHMLVITLLADWLDEKSAAIFEIACLASSIALAAVFYFLIESRLDRFREGLFLRLTHPSKTKTITERSNA